MADKYCHRATFLDALVNFVNPDVCHFNKRCVSVTQSPDNPQRILLQFLDGSTHETDVALGADGIKSSIRKFVLGGTDERIAFSHTVAYRGLIPYDKLQAAGFKTDLTVAPACFMGPSKVCVRAGTSCRSCESSMLTNFDCQAYNLIHNQEQRDRTCTVDCGRGRVVQMYARRSMSSLFQPTTRRLLEQRTYRTAQHGSNKYREMKSRTYMREWAPTLKYFSTTCLRGPASGPSMSFIRPSRVTSKGA